MSVATEDLVLTREKISRLCLMIQRWLGNMLLPRTSRHTSGGVFSPLEEPCHLGIQCSTHLGSAAVLLVSPSLMKEVGSRADMMMVTRPWKGSSRPSP